MKFIEVAHPEGGRFLVHIDHITSSQYRPGEGDTKPRIGLDLDNRQNDVIIFGDEADRVWKTLQKLLGDV
jgi:hypothetical protein